MMTDEQDATKETVRRAADAAISNRNLAEAIVAEREFTQWAMASLVRLGRRVSNALVRAARSAEREALQAKIQRCPQRTKRKRQLRPRRPRRQMQ
jgi:hypothetical protein